VLAIQNVRRLCEENLRGRVDLAVIDVYQEPSRAREANLVAAPTLVKTLPLPRRQLIGTLTDLDSVLRCLDVSPEAMPA
jgi:circadian clock protein KaiB